jgi:hypothetical protein
MGNKKTRTLRGCENIVDAIVNGLDGIVAYSTRLDTSHMDAEDEAQIIIGIQTADKDYLDFPIGTEWLSTASVEAIEEEIKDHIRDLDERGRFTWTRPQSTNNGNATSIGAS